MVNQQILQGNWNEIRGLLRKKWGELTDDELMETGGDLDRLVAVIQLKTGHSREQIEATLDEFTRHSAQSAAQAAEMARQYAEQAAEAWREASERISESLRAGYSQAETVLRQRPAESLAVVFGIGVLAGMLVGFTLRSE